MSRKVLVAAYVFLGGFCICLVLASLRGTRLRDDASLTRQPVVAVTLAQAPAVETEKLKRGGDSIETAPTPVIGDLPAPRKYTIPQLEEEFARLRSERKKRPEAMHELSAWYGHVADPKFSHSKNYVEHIERLKAWHDEIPDSSTRLVVLAKSFIGFAWEARGTGFAGTVTEEGWELFRGRMAEARRLLDQAIDKGVKDGEAYALLIEIAKAEGLPKEETLELLRAGQKLDPGYSWMYAKMAEYLLPRWHGEPGDLERFAAEMTRQVPGDDGLDAFAHVVWQIHHYDRRTLWWGEYDRALLGKSAKVLGTRYPTSPRLMSFAALCAFAAQDQASAKELVKLIGEFDEKEGIWPWKNTHKAFVEWASAPAAPQGEEEWFWAGIRGGAECGFSADGSAMWCPQQVGGELLSIDVKSGQIREQLPGPGGLLNQIEYDNARSWIVASYWQGPLIGWTLWDLKAQDSQPHPTDEQVRALAIHPKEKQIAWAESMTVRIIDLETEKEISKFTLPDYVHRLSFSPSGEQLYVMTGKQYVCNPTTGKIVYEFPSGRPDALVKNWRFDQFAAFDEQDRVYGTAFDTSSSPNKRCLVRGTPDGKSWTPLVSGIGSGRACLSPDRTRVAVAHSADQGSKAMNIELWNVPSGQLITRLGGHWNRITSMQFSDVGDRLASRGGDLVKVWKIGPAPGR